MILPTVTIELDRPRTWKFSGNATIAFYRVLGRDAFKRLEIFQAIEGESVDDQMERSMQQLGECTEVFISLLWAGLLGEDPKLTKEAVGEMVGPGSMAEILPKLLDTLNRSMTPNPTPAPAESETALTASG